MGAHGKKDDENKDDGQVDPGTPINPKDDTGKHGKKDDDEK